MTFSRPLSRPFQLWIELPADLAPAAPRADPFLPMLLPLAMRRGERLRLEGEVSPRLLAGAGHAAALLSAWWPRLRPVVVEAACLSPAPVPTSRAVGSFFSLGVDSWYTALREREAHENISVLVLAHGFEVPLANAGRFASARSAAETAAERTGRRLVAVATNLRALSDARVHWQVMHGPAMAGVALALGHTLRRVLVPSTDRADRLVPRGSHPALDPLWSDEAVELVHDGIEADKHLKVAAIARSALALETLRVCSSEPERDLYNCSRCLKCQGTMISLAAAGALERASTFSGRIEPQLLESQRVPAHDRVFWEDRLDAAQALGDARLARAVRALLRRSAERAAPGWGERLKDALRGFKPRRREAAFPP